MKDQEVTETTKTADTEPEVSANGENLPAAPEPTAAEKAEARAAVAALERQAAKAALEGMSGIEENAMMPFNPRNFEAAWRLSDQLSRSGVVSDGLAGKPGAVLAVMARGAALGIHWSLAVTEMHVIKGKIVMPAAIIAGLIETSPKFEWFEVVESTETSCTVQAKARHWPEPRTYTVTIEEARKAKYLDKPGPWQTRPRVMLAAMARREAGRLWDPARLAGIYAPEEIEASIAERVAETEARTAQVEPKDSTSALRAFSATIAPAGELQAGAVKALPEPTASAAPIETTAKTATPATAAEPPAPETDPEGVAMLDSEQVQALRMACLDGVRPVGEPKLCNRLGVRKLEEVEGKPGETSAELYNRVYRELSSLRKAMEGNR